IRVRDQLFSRHEVEIKKRHLLSPICQLANVRPEIKFPIRETGGFSTAGASRSIVRPPDQQAFVLARHGPVAFARGFLQPFEANQPNSSSSVLNDPKALEFASHKRNRRPTDAENVPDELLREVQGVALDHVSGLQKPPAETRFDSVNGVTGGCLLG